MTCRCASVSVRIYQSSHLTESCMVLQTWSRALRMTGSRVGSCWCLRGTDNKNPSTRVHSGSFKPPLPQCVSCHALLKALQYNSTHIYSLSYSFLCLFIIRVDPCLKWKTCLMKTSMMDLQTSTLTLSFWNMSKKGRNFSWRVRVQKCVKHETRLFRCNSQEQSEERSPWRRGQRSCESRWGSSSSLTATTGRQNQHYYHHHLHHHQNKNVSYVTVASFQWQ